MGAYHEKTPRGFSRGSALFGLYKPDLWWRRRDSNLRPRAYEFWGSTFGGIPDGSHSAPASQKSRLPTIDDRPPNFSERIEMGAQKGAWWENQMRSVGW